MARSRQLAGLGNIAAKDGHFSEAVRRFTEAIDLYPFDHRSVSKRGEGLLYITVVYYPLTVLDTPNHIIVLLAVLMLFLQMGLLSA
jgi:hypothetical protein